MTAMSMSQPQPDDAVFLSTLLHNKPAHLYTMVWTMPDKITRTFTEKDAALAYVRERQDAQDVYIAVGMGDAPLAANRRYRNDTASALYGLWADVDIRDEQHKKSNLPETEDEALALVYSTGLVPTMVVNSGHGLHAWWLFDEPLLITEENRSEIQAFVFRWIESVRRRARIKGWTIDATQDLARVLRVAGTTNHKDEKNPVPVVLRECRGARYAGLDDFAESIDSAPLPVFDNKPDIQRGVEDLTLPEDVRKLARTLTVNPQAEPPMSLWHALISQNPKAKQTFDHKRRDMLDDSLSEYDFSLALMAMLADEEWTNQQITDLLIHHRRKYAKDAKELKLRADYYARTLLRAKDRVKATTTARDLNDKLHGVGDDSGATESPSPKADASAQSSVAAPKRKAISVEDWAKQFQHDDDAPTRKTPKLTHASDDAEAAADALDAADMADMADELDMADEDGDESDESDIPTQGVSPFAEPLSDEVRRMATIRALYGPNANMAQVYGTLNDIFENKFFKILRVVRMVSSPPLFGMVIRMNFTGEMLNIHLGDIGGIMNQKQFIQSVAAYASVVMHMRKQKEWDNVVATMLMVAENEAIGEEATETGMMTSWLNGFIDRFMIARDWSGEDGRGEPPTMGAFTYNGSVCFAGAGLLYWLRTDSMERVSPQNLGKMLRAVGAKTVTVPCHKGGVRTTRSVWALPEEMSQRYLRLVYAMNNPEREAENQE